MLSQEQRIILLCSNSFYRLQLIYIAILPEINPCNSIKKQFSSAHGKDEIRNMPQSHENLNFMANPRPHPTGNLCPWRFPNSIPTSAITPFVHLQQSLTKSYSISKSCVHDNLKKMDNDSNTISHNTNAVERLSPIKLLCRKPPNLRNRTNLQIMMPILKGPSWASFSRRWRHKQGYQWEQYFDKLQMIAWISHAGILWLCYQGRFNSYDLLH